MSSRAMKDDFDKANLNCEFEDIIVCDRSVNFDLIDQVANIPVNEKKKGKAGNRSYKSGHLKYE